MNDTKHKSDEQGKRGGRRRTGSIRRNKRGLWQAVITLPGGAQKRLPPGGLPEGTSEAKAREFAAYWSEKTADLEPRHPKVTPQAREEIRARRGVDVWVDTWMAEREAAGMTSVRENRSHWEHHIGPVLGDKHPRDWSKNDMRAVSASLDDKVRAGSISWKTAINIWGTATRMCDDAANSKRPAIRCREDNPAQEVRGPDRGARAAQEFLYPSELLAFTGCKDVPLVWRRAVAIAVYTGLRRSELEVLRWQDVDIEHGKMHVHRARDRVTGEIKATKGDLARRPPIHPELIPLLTMMRAEAGGNGPVIRLPSERDMARGLRRYLEKAGVIRSSLYERTGTTQPIKWHDLRGTFATWHAVAGTDPMKIKQWCGHSQFSTTEGYIRTADDIGRDNFGSPFPVLPIRAYSDDSNEESLRFNPAQAPFVAGFLRSGRDSNPRPPA